LEKRAGLRLQLVPSGAEPIQVHWSDNKSQRAPQDNNGVHRLYLGVTGRLIILVLLPLIVLTSVSAPLALRARVYAQRAEAANREVPALTAIIHALDAVAVEQGQAEALLYATGSGFPIEVVDNMLGSNVLTEMHIAERATDRDVGLLARLWPACSWRRSSQPGPSSPAPHQCRGTRSTRSTRR
jgi:hypothetical protein